MLLVLKNLTNCSSISGVSEAANAAYTINIAKKCNYQYCHWAIFDT